MLKLSASLNNQPVISLRLGGRVATAIEPIINPHNLKILGWWCRAPGRSVSLVLLAEDVREMTAGGLTVNDDEALSLPDDLVRHKEILDIDFKLIEKTVKTKRHKLGKVEDYSYNDGMFVQKLYVGRSLVKVLTPEPTLLIDRTQIVEVTDNYILVKDPEVEVGNEELATAPA